MCFLCIDTYIYVYIHTYTYAHTFKHNIESFSFMHVNDKIATADSHLIYLEEIIESYFGQHRCIHYMFPLSAHSVLQ